MIRKVMFAGLLAVAANAFAAELTISIEVPRLGVAEYHAPYTAVWIESATEGDKKFIKTLSVWYDTKNRNNEGQKWLKDLRQWWRRDGRTLDLPADGLSGATKLSGVHALRFVVGQPPLSALPDGNYQLSVEMARESGGRELIKIPFTWPVKEMQTLSAQGSTEVGKVNLTMTP